MRRGSSPAHGGATLEELEAFYDRLQGPLGQVLRTTGVIIDRKMRDRGIGLDSLTDIEVVEIYSASFAEAAAQTFPHMDLTTLEADLSAMSAHAAMTLASTARSTDAPN